ncbi:universal stress protein [Isobaculum melis]|uniref:Universal stress protein n=1 Tax=Isobaculum melis TaxID=142588 RepID=A0A1H9RJA6_9LACT|nr:universal stress protein [Isobaculum melis]SER72029.1 Nucleotide-binding universal stress protein, UspA family [Isobaculum melis]
MLNQYHHILVAIDGSDESERAFQKAVEVAKRNQSTLLLTHVIDTRAFQSVTSYDGAMAEQATKSAETTLAEYQAYAKKQGIKKVEVSIEYGSPKAIIAKQLPEENNIDLIMLGATGLNAVERLFIGSVSDYVIRHAHCDVLIVRTGLDNQPIDEKKEA